MFQQTFHWWLFDGILILADVCWLSLKTWTHCRVIEIDTISHSNFGTQIKQIEIRYLWSNGFWGVVLLAAITLAKRFLAKLCSWIRLSTSLPSDNCLFIQLMETNVQFRIFRCLLIFRIAEQILRIQLESRKATLYAHFLPWTHINSKSMNISGSVSLAYFCKTICCKGIFSTVKLV